MFPDDAFRSFQQKKAALVKLGTQVSYCEESCHSSFVLVVRNFLMSESIAGLLFLVGYSSTNSIQDLHLIVLGE